MGNGRISAKQAEILEYIKKYSAQKKYPPSIREISANFNLSSPATAHVHVKKLIENAIPYVISGMVMFGIVFSMKLKINVYAAITIEIFVGVVTYFFALLLLLKVAKRNPKEMVSMFFEKR